jgi:hypothetical protein
MTDATVHYRGVTSERRRLPALPVVGSYIYGPGAERRLWQVSAVVFDGKAVDVFVVEVSAMLATELTTAWAAWGEPATAADEAHPAERVAHGRGDDGVNLWPCGHKSPRAAQNAGMMGLDQGGGNADTNGVKSQLADLGPTIT